jgi:predicted Zn-dependent peptidase
MIAQELDGVGGRLNAFTGKEFTVYYAIVQDKHIDVAADVLSDIFLNSNYDTKDMDVERHVILEEIKMYEDTPDEEIHDIFTSAALPGSGFGNITIGTEETVKSIDREKILRFIKKYYTPQNLVISIAGNIKPEEAKQLVSTAFSGYSGNFRTPDEATTEPVACITLKEKKTEQVHLIIGTKGVSQTDPDRYAFSILDNILGGSMSSRLFQEIREKRGLAYSVFSFNQSFKNAGLCGIYAGTRKENFEKTVDLILNEVKKIKKNGITKEEFERAKEFIKGSLVLALESSNSRMNYMGRSYFYYDKILTVDETLSQIDAVKPEKIIEIAESHYTNKYLSLAVIGDFNELPIKKIEV